MPLVIQVMTSDGPRYMPTRIGAPSTYRHLQLPFVEQPPDDCDLALSECVWSWMSASMLGTNANVKRLTSAIYLLHDIVTAARFLDATAMRCEVAAHPITDDRLFLGRSALVRPAGATAEMQGWITSLDDGHVELASFSAKGFALQLVVPRECLGEDGSVNGEPDSHEQ